MWLEEHGSDFAVLEDSFSALSSLAKSFVLIIFFGVFVGVCVAGYSQAKNEILELRLPLKLLADENKVKNQNISPNFEFIFL